MMSQVKVEKIAQTGQPLSVELGIPDLFLDSINCYWQPKADILIIEVLLKNRVEKKWVKVGNLLMSKLLAGNPYLGICIDGQWPLDLSFSWARSSATHTAPAVIEVKWMLTAHPAKKNVVIPSITWCSVQSTKSPWVESIWESTGSNLFNQGCNLLLTAYNKDIMDMLDWNQPLNIQSFCQTLRQAVGWIIPLDENIGFIVGLQSGSKAYQALI